MGLLAWLQNLSQTKVNLKSFTSLLTKTPIYNEVTTPVIYFSDSQKYMVENEFLNHDGYFTKLIIDNKLIGYIFRCSHKDIEFINKNDEKIVIPLLVTCFFQPVISFNSIDKVKVLGKDHTLKTGIRTIKQYLSTSVEKDVTNFVNSCLTLDHVFPTYDDLVFNYKDHFDLFGIKQSDYDEMLDYIKKFDEKTYIYYKDIDKKNIVKIWLKY